MSLSAKFCWRALAPFAVVITIALLPVPEGLAQHAWYFFAIFAGVIAGLILEPLPGVTLADGLSRVGFVKWFAQSVTQHMGGLSPLMAMLLLVALFFLVHYMFASIIAHVTAVLPVMLAIGMTIPGLPVPQFALLLCLTLGLMGIISAVAGLLAAWRPIRRDLSRRLAADRHAMVVYPTIVR